jgi:hypothetical protein
MPYMSTLVHADHVLTGPGAPSDRAGSGLPGRNASHAPRDPGSAARRC